MNAIDKEMRYEQLLMKEMSLTEGEEKKKMELEIE